MLRSVSLALQPADLVKGAQGLALFAAAEDFSTNKVRSSCSVRRCFSPTLVGVVVVVVLVQARILSNPGTLAALVGAEDAYLKGIAVDADSRKKVRPLLDLVAEAKRKAAK